MATAKTNGSNYSVPPNLGGSGSVNGGGVATRITSTSVLRKVSVSKDTTGVLTSIVVDGDSTDKAVNSGVFAYNNKKPISARVTKDIAGVASTVLATTANVPGQLRSINKRESYVSEGTSTAFRLGYFNLYTGKYNPAPTPVTETPGTDNAANVSRTSPGDLVFRTGAKLPVRNRDYSKKTG